MSVSIQPVRDLIILGTGVHGAEMAEIVARVNAVRPTWNLLGYITGKELKPGDKQLVHPLLGGMESLGRYPDAALVSENEFPRPLLPTLPRERFISLIDPSCFIAPSARIGVGCVLYPFCFVGLNAVVGDFVFSLAGSVINHDDVIEDRVVFTTGVSLAGVVHVEADCYLGQACNVRQFLRIGRDSMIGMGAVITKDVPPNSVMIGNPARRLRDRHPTT